MRVTLVPNRRRLDCGPDETLLECFRRSEVPISYSCTDGRCGLCRCYVGELSILEGEGTDVGGLPALRESLACQTVPQGDCVVEIPEDPPVILPARTAKGQVQNVESLSPDAVRLTIRVDRPIQYLGGQHFEIGFAGQPPRYYSATPTPDPLQLRFDVQIHPFGAVSQFVRAQLGVGDSVRIRGPLGRNFVRVCDPSSLLLVSSGTGLGALTGVLRDIAASGMKNAVHVYAGFTLSEQVYGRDELSRLSAAVANMRRCDVAVASGSLRRGDRRGLLTDLLGKDLGILTAFSAYVFGTPSAVEATARRLLLKGLSPRRLYMVPFQMSDNAQPPKRQR